MTGWLVQRDVLPRYGYGELDYRQYLAHRAVEEPSNWILKVDDDKVGQTVMKVKPLSDGNFVISNRLHIATTLVEPIATARSTIDVDSDFIVHSVGHLHTFQVAIKIATTNGQKRLGLKGTVEENELVLVPTGLGTFDREYRVDIDPSMLLVDVFGPIDRVPGLRLGKKWQTRSIDPISLVVPTGSLWGRKPSLSIIYNEVVDEESIEWGNRSFYCYRIEHRHDNMKSTTWARVSDGRVLRHEFPFGDKRVVVELDPIIQRLKDD